MQNTLKLSSNDAGWLVARATIAGKLQERDVHLNGEPLYLATFISEGEHHWTLIFRKQKP